MMRSMYGAPHHHHHAAGRAPYPYPACTARYAPHQFMNSAAAYSQFSAAMPGSMQGMYAAGTPGAAAAAAGSMAAAAATTAHGQQATQRLPMAADYGLSLVSDTQPCTVGISGDRSSQTSEILRPA